ncbi:hypothetical protein BJ508DRAFT_348294 [Ascobolus immersus RN42]|uniref:Uncharacterized protein n=1 Tax=Ascobolus immersus RN42 TaxID=1160509 RepID=A0A3N4ICA1_ASCIM|nr:hypothetical protein BJ508DRAFT_348294 [Ascobolus immersus RN42]
MKSAHFLLSNTEHAPPRYPDLHVTWKAYLQNPNASRSWNSSQSSHWDIKQGSQYRVAAHLLCNGCMLVCGGRGLLEGSQKSTRYGLITDSMAWVWRQVLDMVHVPGLGTQERHGNPYQLLQNRCDRDFEDRVSDAQHEPFDVEGGRRRVDMPRMEAKTLKVGGLKQCTAYGICIGRCKDMHRQAAMSRCAVALRNKPNCRARSSISLQKFTPSPSNPKSMHACNCKERSHPERTIFFSSASGVQQRKLSVPNFRSTVGLLAPNAGDRCCCNKHLALWGMRRRKVPRWVEALSQRGVSLLTVNCTGESRLNSAVGA